MGNRIAKHVKPKNSATHSTYYVRDAQGNTIATYSNSTETITLEEQPIYGSSRIGVYSPTADTGIVRGLRTYEATNHLGNVLTTFTDRIILSDNYEYTPEQTTATDYYPFGMPMPGRSFSMGNYRYGFNGQEKVNEVYGEGKVYDLGLRMYDARIVRMFKIDPRTFEYPWQSTYVYHRNSPISIIDFLGGGDTPNPNDEDNFTGFGDDKVGTTESPIEISAVTITPEQSLKNQQSRNFAQQNEDYLKLRGQYSNTFNTTNNINTGIGVGTSVLGGNYGLTANQTFRYAQRINGRVVSAAELTMVHTAQSMKVANALGRVNLVTGVLGTAYSVNNVISDYQSGGWEKVNGWDISDALVGGGGVATGIFLASNPIGWGISIGVGIYFGARLFYDLSKD